MERAAHGKSNQLAESNSIDSRLFVCAYTHVRGGKWLVTKLDLLDNISTMSDGKTKLIDFVRSVSNKALVEIKENSPKHQLFLGAILGFATAVPSIKIARALSLFTGSVMILLAVKNNCECYLDLSKYANINMAKIFEMIKQNGPLSVGFTAGYLLGFGYI